MAYYQTIGKRRQTILAYCINIDYIQWSIRAIIIHTCAILGIILFLISFKYTKKISKLAILQIFLSLAVPITVGLFLHERRIAGASCSCDWDQLADEITSIKNGAYSSLIIFLLYTLLISSTTLTVQKLFYFLTSDSIPKK